jgi:hypothetical protein
LRQTQRRDKEAHRITVRVTPDAALEVAHLAHAQSGACSQFLLRQSGCQPVTPQGVAKGRRRL